MDEKREDVKHPEIPNKMRDRLKALAKAMSRNRRKDAESDGAACCSKIILFFTLFCCVYFLESIGGTYMISAIQAIEKQFQIPSRASGTLVSASDLGYIPTVVILSYWGSRGNRAKWIGGGCLLIAFANFLIATPNFLFPRAEPKLNISQIDTALTIPPHLLADNVTPSQLLDFAPIKERLPYPLRTFLLAAAGEEAPADNGIDVLDLFGIDLDKMTSVEAVSTNQTRRKRQTDMEQRLKTLGKQVLAGKRNASEFFDALKFELRNFQLSDEGKVKLERSAAAPFGFCNAVVNSLKDTLQKMKCESGNGGGSGAFAVVFVALIMVGVGHSMPWSLGLPLLDDNIKRTNLPLYFAGTFLIKIMGPVVGFLIGAICNRLYYTLEQPSGLSPRDPRWIGAWWLGFLFIAAVLVLPSLALVFFPHAADDAADDSDDGKATAPEKKSRDQLALVDRHRVDEHQQHDVGTQVKLFASAMLIVFKSPVYTGSLVGRLFDAFAFKGFFVFLPKYLETHYGMPQYKVSMYLGLFGIIGFAVGMLSGSFIMRRFKLEGRKAAAVVGACSLLSGIISVSKVFLGCHSVVNSVGQLGIQNNFNFTLPCNADCFCEPVNLFPVCSEVGTPYFSPCTAGCKALNFTEGAQMSISFADCSCIDVGNIVSRDFCTDDCGSMIAIYFLLIIISGIVGGLGVIPSILIVLRSIPPEHRSIALGISGFLVSLISTLPSPIVFGLVIDSACLLWERSCTGTGACSIYEPTTLRVRIHVFYGALRAIALIFDVWVWYWAKGLNIMADDDDAADAAPPPPPIDERDSPDGATLPPDIYELQPMARDGDVQL